MISAMKTREFIGKTEGIFRGNSRDLSGKWRAFFGRFTGIFRGNCGDLRGNSGGFSGDLGRILGKLWEFFGGIAAIFPRDRIFIFPNHERERKGPSKIQFSSQLLRIPVVSGHGWKSDSTTGV